MSLAEVTSLSNRDLLEYYAGFGFRVFPVEDGKKKPAIVGWKERATSNISNLLTDKSLFGGKFKDNEIATLTGYEFIVVDSDDGELEDMPTTPTYKTQSRGFHYLVKVPSGLAVPNIIGLIPDVDIKGMGGLAVLPSQANKREWIYPPDEVEIADCPKWLMEKIQDHIESKASYSPSGSSTTYSFSYEPILEASRNDTLFDHALFLAYRAFIQEDIEAELTSINDNYCDPPLPQEEVNTIAESASSYIKGQKNKKKTELIRSLRSAIISSTWKGIRAKNIKSILISLLTEDISRYELNGSDLEVTISYRRIAEKSGLSLTTIKKNLKGMIPKYVSRGRTPKGKAPGSLIIRSSSIDEFKGAPINNPSPPPTINSSPISSKGELFIGAPVNSSALTLFEFNSMRMRNLGKSACMILEILMERPHSRKEITERMGYSRNGANGVLQKLKGTGLVVSEDGVYSLTENFLTAIEEELQWNKKDLDHNLVRVHRAQREDYYLRLDAWKMAGDDFDEIIKTAREVGGSYLFQVAHNRYQIMQELTYQRYIEMKRSLLEDAENE